MHWSKSRHVDYEACPRRFFYSEIAALRNPKIAKLANMPSPALVRHEIVRKAISLIAESQNPRRKLRTILKTAKADLAAQIGNQYEVNAEFSIVEACINSFVTEILPEIKASRLLYVSDGNPIEFFYDGLSMYVLVEMVIDRGDHVEIFNWKTGASGFHKQEELELRAGGLTCWARSILKEVNKPIIITDVFLRELSPVTRFQATFEDHELRPFVAQAKAISRRYGASAKIADFQARPNWITCRFCPFKSVCFEYEAFAEPDYELATLENALTAAKRNREKALAEVEGEYRSVFLSHVSDDKEDIVRPFARALEAEGISYWLDEAEMSWGDSLTRGINKGLAISDYVVCFISEKFIERGWPVGELGSALAAQMSDGHKRLLPIFVSDRDAVLKAFPMLRDILYKDWAAGIDEILKDLKAIVAVEREPE
jgi:hypothetical protein